MSSRVVGILGGGQLGRMLAASASILNISVVILDAGHSPAKQVLAPSNPELAHIDGSFADPAKIRELADKVDVLTVEIEHVNADALEEVQTKSIAEGHPLAIHPSPSTIRLIQDKLRQKEHLESRGCPVAPFLSLDSSTVEGVHAVAQKLGLPLMLKSRTLAYDGRGNFALHSLSQATEAIAALGEGRSLYAEKWVSFVKEIAVMVVRGTEGEVRAYPVVETVHKDNICHVVWAPLRGEDALEVGKRAREVAEESIRTFEGAAGVFGVEMFLMEDGSISINEIAPRPHNSGHYTIEACLTSQYENHLRAILSLPLGATNLKVPSSAMLNLLGASSSMEEINKTVQTALTVPGASVHLYGKKECRKGRKMGHITVVGQSDAEVRERMTTLLLSLPDASPSSPSSSSLTPEPGFSHPFPLVSIIIGSDSDLPTMLPCARLLSDFSVPYELTIVSAHRTPLRLLAHARSARGRGIRCIVAAAGGAAHLPGMVAALTPLPVIGVPVQGKVLDGVDSLYSIVQMPRGIPVATVAVGNSVNAALLAVRTLSAGMPELVNKMEKYMKNMENEVMGKVETLKEVGWEKYVVGGSHK